ncbi:MAG: hypothetical protein ACI9YG_001672, partial [Candidatus Azotimanducaceae bacterium]
YCLPAGHAVILLFEAPVKASPVYWHNGDMKSHHSLAAVSVLPNVADAAISCKSHR